jgi:predicted NBD/HSP70 family sugar kinase
MRKISKPKSVKHNNRKVVLSLLRKSGPITISELAEKSRLSKPTIMKIVQYYLMEGLVNHLGKGTSTEEGGKKPNLYSFNPDSKYSMGIQLSGDEGLLIGVLTDLNSRICQQIEFPLTFNTDLTTVLDKIALAYRQLLDLQRLSSDRLIGLAVGTHGYTNFETGVVFVSPHNPIWGRDVPFKKLVEEHIRDAIPVQVDNQIRYQAFVEKMLGAGQQERNIIVLRCGIGAIAGVVQENTLKRGKHFLAGHVGHMIVDPHSQEDCLCGARGCFEVLVGTERLLRTARAGWGQHKESLIFQNTSSEQITVDDIIRASNQNDAWAKSLIDEVIKWFAIALSNLNLMYDPDLVILQGVYTRAGDYFLQRLRERVNHVSLLNVEKEIRIEYSQMGKQAGAIGAASYLINEFFR